MATPRKVMVILSSVRDGRHGAKVAQAVMKHLAPYADRIQPEILGKYLIYVYLIYVYLVTVASLVVVPVVPENHSIFQRARRNHSIFL